LIWEADRDFGSRTGSDELGMVGRIQFNEEKTTVGRVTSEDVAVAGGIGISAGDHARETGLLDCPNGVLTRGATTEVGSYNQNRSSSRFGLVEREICATNVAEDELTVAGF
jgi:hypothetical protein